MAFALSKIFPWIDGRTKGDYPLLKKGSNGSYVKILQEQLQRNGFYKGPVDGDFGQNTHDAVVYYQQTHLGENKKPLTVDGIVGTKTWWAIFNPIAKTPIPKTSNLIPSGISEQRTKVLEKALIELKKPVKEIPDGSNWGPDVKKYLEFCGIGPAYWCAAFVNWVVNEGLGFVPWKSKIAHVATLFNKGKEYNFSYKLSTGYKPRPGDLFIMVYESGSGHIGIILRVSEDGSELNVIEGNSGNRVALRTRDVGKNHHIGYMNIYGDEKEPYTFEKGLVSSDNSGIGSTR